MKHRGILSTPRTTLPGEVERLIANQIEYHNCRRRHSALGYTAPIDYIIQEEILPRPALGLALQRT